MNRSPQELTDIQRFYKNSTVFLTGAEDFLGKLCLEKVLRSLPVNKVYVLVKIGKDVLESEGLQRIFESPAFDLIKRTNPDVLQKVSLIEGDCALPMLGLSQKDQDTFINEVNVVFHVAATTKYDEALRKAVFTNIRGTKDLITLAQRVKNLKTFVYVGTAFSNCIRSEIKEEIYPTKIKGEKLINVCENLDVDSINSLTDTMIKPWPNTYTFSTQVTEDYINRKARDIPICIVRPTIVVSTFSEPMAAFVDNVYNLAGFMCGTTLGVSRITYYKNITLDIVPADFVINQCIAAGWQTGELFKPLKTEVPIYHVSSALDNPITQDQVYDTCEYYGRQIPTEKMLLYPLTFRTTCRHNYLVLRMIFHTWVAFIIDFGLKLQGMKPMYAAQVVKLHKFQESYDFLVTHNFHLHNENTHKILRKMTFNDRELFDFDITKINWHTYFSQYVKGLRFYIFGDPIHTVPEGQKHYNYLRNIFIVGVITIAVLLYAIGKVFLFKAIPAVFALGLYIMRSVVCST